MPAIGEVPEIPQSEDKEEPESPVPEDADIVGVLQQMAQPNAITDLQAVDFAVGGVLAGAYDGLKDDRPKAFCRFLERPVKSKIFRCDNETPRDLIKRIAQHEKDTGARIDLPVVAYYRAPGLVSDMNGKPHGYEVERYLDDNNRAISFTPITITLSYSFLWLAWDKPTLDKMSLAWYCYVAQWGRRYSRFKVPYLLNGEPLEIMASITVPRDIQGDNSSGDQAEGRLWASRCLVEVNTQVIYGREVKPINEITALGLVRLIR